MSEHEKESLLKSPVLGDFDPEKSVEFIQMFLGTDRTAYQRYEKLLEHWAIYNQARSEKDVDPSYLAACKATYDEYVAEKFGDTDKEQIDRLADGFFNFMMDLTETEFYRNDRFRKLDWKNVTKIEKEGVKPMPEIRYLIPAAGGKHSMKDAMRRNARRSAGDAENIGIILRNSLIHIRIKRPTTLELARLIESINREIVGYVRRVNGSSLTLARVSIARALWRFIADRITWCSVKDTQDYYELANDILWSDIGAMATGLIAATGQRGVDMSLQHISESCNWSSFKRVDPSLLVHYVDDFMNEKQKESLNQLINGTRTFSREEMKKYREMSTYGVDFDMPTPSNNGFLTIGVPTLADSFVQFDVFVEQINPAIREARADNIDQDKYEQQMSSIIAAVQGAEYAQWVKSMTLNPDPDTDEEPIVYNREDNPTEFSEGIYSLMTDDDEIAADLIKKIRREAPAMSYTVVGVPNFVCEKCNKDTSADNGGIHGITPIDPLMAFFIHTQLILTKKVRAGVQEQLEAL